MLAGRDDERVLVRGLLAQACNSAGSALVLHGLPGVGKSTLLVAAAGDAAADGFTVLRTSGIESESPLAFAALQRLLRPVLRLAERLPAPQARSLRRAFGEEDGEVDRFLVFLGALSLLAEAAEQAPVLAVVDDAHWLDDASAAALLFVARRLQAERIALLFAARDDDVRRFDAGELPTLALGELDASDAGVLLTALAGVPVPGDVLDRLVTGTGGNPLALVELANALPTGQLSGHDPLPVQLPLTEGVERAFLDRVRRLPPGAQAFLLVAAADDSGRAAIVRQAALALDASSEDVGAAEDSGLVRVIDGVVTLRHPLVRSAVYGAATRSQRRAAHRALADALVGSGDVDRRAWHRAAAVEEPDESVVADLDQVAERAGQRGGLEAASAAWERAAELTVAAGPRAARLLSAAGAAWAGAQPGRARALAEAARAAAGSVVVRADVDRLRARIEWNIGSGPVGHRILLQAARDVAGADFTRATVMARMAAAAATFGADSGIDIDPTEFVGDPDSLPPGAARSSALLLSGFAHIARGNLRDAAAEFRLAFAEDTAGGDVDLVPNLGLAALYIGDDDVALREYGRFVARARDAGAPVTILYGLARRAAAEISTGDWSTAAAGSAEALDLARGTGRDPLGSLPLAWLTLLAALRGDQPEFDRCRTEFDRPTRGRDVGLTSVVSRDVMLWARGVAAADTPDAALHHLEQITHAMVTNMSALDRIEVAARAGRADRVGEWADELATMADLTGAPWAIASAAHGRALLADGSEAQSLFERALDAHARSPRRVDQARTELAFGEFLRRSRRRVDAREHLRAALDTFEDVGAERWATRARHELRASGETSRRRDSSTPVDLTPQERHVAELVRQGLSNRDAAAQLFLSPRTIDFHLRNVFAKLAVSSRAELAALELP
ncbi:MAG: ATP-binding protein [Kineosporiaceae bacterium]